MLVRDGILSGRSNSLVCMLGKTLFLFFFFSRTSCGVIASFILEEEEETKYYLNTKVYQYQVFNLILKLICKNPRETQLTK